MDSIEWKEGKIINTPLEGQMKNSYIDYAMSVIVTRALKADHKGWYEHNSYCCSTQKVWSRRYQEYNPSDHPADG